MYIDTYVYIYIYIFIHLYIYTYALQLRGKAAEAFNSEDVVELTFTHMRLYMY